MRKDIQFNIKTGDLKYSKSPVHKTTYQYSWVENPIGLERYVYGEITIPYNITEKSIRESGVSVVMPYTPINKEFCIRIKRVRDDGYYSYIHNTKNGSEWFVAQAGLYGKKIENLFVCQAILINNEHYYIQLKDDKAIFYSGECTDIFIDAADRQNANLLLKCVPTNFYRFPLSGVGLIKWLHSNMKQEELARVLQNEFQEDGVLAKNISYNFETKDLIMDLSTISD